jgi:hypothetical protein
LIEALESEDADAEVLFMGQPSYPFEYTVTGVCSRADFEEPEEGEGKESDVFLVEGKQVRYGSREAWDAVR